MKLRKVVINGDLHFYATDITKHLKMARTANFHEFIPVEERRKYGIYIVMTQEQIIEAFERRRVIETDLAHTILKEVERQQQKYDDTGEYPTYQKSKTGKKKPRLHKATVQELLEELIERVG